MGVMSAKSPPPDESSPAGNDPETSSDAAPLPEPVWTYRGYQLRASEFTTAMVHFFRAEVQRANVWRQRLDMTFNWAVVTTAAALSFAFGGAGNNAVIILDLLLVTLFLYIEARRYRYYELWSYRVRLMETDFFAAMLVPPFHPAPDWAETLAGHLLHPAFPISAWEAFGRRLRRNYLWIYAIILLAWMVKVSLQPVAIKSWTGFVARAAIGGLPGEVVSIIVGLSFVALVIVSVLTMDCTLQVVKCCRALVAKWKSNALPKKKECAPGSAPAAVVSNSWCWSSRTAPPPLLSEFSKKCAAG